MGGALTNCTRGEATAAMTSKAAAKRPNTSAGTGTSTITSTNTDSADKLAGRIAQKLSERPLLLLKFSGLQQNENSRRLKG